MSVIKIRWTVNELDNVLTLFDVQKVYRSSAQSGPYVEITTEPTRVPLVAGQTSYLFDDVGGSLTDWYRVSYYNSTTLLESDQSDEIQGVGGGNYVTVADVRAEGFSATQYDDARVLDTIRQVESFIERVTGQWFYPRAATLRVDGTGSDILPMRTPIIQVDQIRVLSVWSEWGTIYGDVTLENVRVANRHLTQGMTSPDDREAPALIFEVYEHGDEPGGTRHVSTWHKGVHNIEVQGWFGYTDPDWNSVGETEEGSQIPISKGVTPYEIKRAALLLVARWLPLASDTDEVEDATRRREVKRYKTRDQEIEFSEKAIAAASGRDTTITGDPEIDSLLGMFTGHDEIAFV